MVASVPGPDGLVLVGAGAAFKETICDMLAGTRLFADFAWSDIDQLAAYLQCYEAAAGTVVFAEGDPGSYMCIVVSGQVEILKEGNDGEQHRLVLVGPGKTIGEMSIIDGEPRSATCVTTDDSVMLMLTKEHYGRIIRERPLLAVHIVSRLAKLMSQRLRGLSGQLVDYLHDRD